jgi:hypothetical protein
MYRSPWVTLLCRCGSYAHPMHQCRCGRWMVGHAACLACDTVGLDAKAQREELKKKCKPTKKE